MIQHLDINMPGWTADLGLTNDERVVFCYIYGVVRYYGSVPTPLLTSQIAYDCNLDIAEITEIVESLEVSSKLISCIRNNDDMNYYSVNKPSKDKKK